MRKIKKINGFLVVKFNDREKREYEGTALGEYGVIDAEVYANEGARTKIDELKKVKFSKRSNKAAQGDKSLTVDVDMMIVGGVYQDGVAPV